MKNSNNNFDDIQTCPHCNGEFLDGDAFTNHKKVCPQKSEEPEEPEKPETPETPEPETPEVSKNSEKVKKLPVNRDYDWSTRIPSGTPEYLESDSEVTRIMADITHREDSGQMPRYLISGDTGAGKTHLSKTIAEDLSAPLFTIQGKYSMDESDLLGSPVLVNGETIWTDGTLTKALLASQDREVVLLVDELNRARPESKGVLFSALDDRCRVELDARGGEVVEGNPDNLIVIGTINEGSEYAVQELDKAEKRRFGRKFEVKHLGLNHPDKERQVIQQRTPASSEVAERLVEISNKIRESSENQASVVDSGVPTSSILDWSRTAYAYAQAGVGNPIVESARDTIAKPIFQNDRVRQEVMETVRDHADSAPYDGDGFREWSDNPEKYDENVCEYCGEVYDGARGVAAHQAQSDCGE